MFKRVLGICLILGFGMTLIAGCEAGGKTCPADKQGPKTCAKKSDKPCHAKVCKCGKKCSGALCVRCADGKKQACCCMKCAKMCAAKCKGATVVNMKCPCGGKGKDDLKKMVSGVEQHYCCKGCMSKGS